ncbi:hypothetical protein MRB53_004473 [Persea americana]|uniref:Uncharacterized protein n=1 Tax=Persea americana TaxID=3435 RepID=A0ACC2MAM7_PERAE|nr:hypothetical protein MRB53_004473 [Persea americana]
MLVSSNVTTLAWDLGEAEALLKWKASLQSHSLQSWSLVNDTSSSSKLSSPCRWAGITCNKASHITNINLGNASLEGTLDNFNFASFPYLTHLNLANNSLHGSIPSHIGTIAKLTFLDLSANYFSSILPSSLSNLTRISKFNISLNEITGDIALCFRIFANWTKLTSLQLCDNHFSGNIPSEIGLLTNVNIAHIQDKIEMAHVEPLVSSAEHVPDAPSDSSIYAVPTSAALRTSDPPATSSLHTTVTCSRVGIIKPNPLELHICI